MVWNFRRSNNYSLSTSGGKTYLTNNENFYIRNDSVVHMAAGDRHTIIVTKSGRAYAFGDNNSGQLGLGHINTVKKVSCIKSLKFGTTGEKILLAACGSESSLVATNQGSLYAFGLNHYCQLGFQSDESISKYPCPVKIEYLPLKISWKQLAMGAEHTCVLANDGRVYVWGSNEVGQCGLERKYQMIRTPRELRLGYLVNAISCGYYHTALISVDGRLFLFGSNSNRQLGHSTSDLSNGPLEVSLPDRIQGVACGYQHTVVLTEKGDVYTCGLGGRGQLGLGRKISFAKHFQMIKNLPKNLTAIAAGAAHTAIIDSCGKIYLFGDGKHGKLNHRTYSNRFKPYFLDQFRGYNVLGVVCGGCQTIIFGQKKPTEYTIDCQMKPIENINKISNNEDFSSQTDSHSNSEELFASTENVLMNTRHVRINPKLQIRRRRSDNDKTESLKTDVLNRTVALEQTTDNRVSSIDKTSRYQRRLDQTNRSKTTVKFTDERSLSEERSFATSEQNNGNDSSMKNKDQNSSPISSSTTSGRTSSSISSLESENLVPTPDSADAIEPNANQTLDTSYKINSTDPSIITASKSGFFSRIRTGKSARKLSITPNSNSKTCSLM